MSIAYEYEELHHLVDRLTPAQVRRLALLVSQDDELSQVADHQRSVGAAEDAPPAIGLAALIGSVDGPPDLAERHDDYVRDRMRHRFSDTA